VLDLHGAGYIGSALLGLLINVRTKVKHTHGTLVICRLDPMLHRVLRSGSMERLFVIAAERDEALSM